MSIHTVDESQCRAANIAEFAFPFATAIVIFAERRESQPKERA